jgi:Acetyltransferase (GNAT) domain
VKHLNLQARSGWVGQSAADAPKVRTETGMSSAIWNKLDYVAAVRPWEGATIFHSDWWLDAVAPGEWRKLEVAIGDRTVGVLPIWERPNLGIEWLTMPPFTHILGPAIDAGVGGENTRLHRRFKITSDLLAQVPRAAIFSQALDWTTPDVLAFQAAGYKTRPHYTILIDCESLEDAWSGMRQKTRRFIRRAEEKYSTSTCVDINQFMDFYCKNLQGAKVNTLFYRLTALYNACIAHDSGKIIAAYRQNGELAAAIFIVWGLGRAYYLLTTRDKTLQDFGVVSLLIWRAIQEAHARSLVLDLDGIYSRSIYHFLSGFGGVVRSRMIVEKQALWVDLAKAVRGWLPGEKAFR